MAYLIDASSLIEAKNRYYGFDICPGFWDWLLQQNDAGRVFSIDRIRVELESGNDELATWARERGSGFFLPLDPLTIQTVTEVNTWVVQNDFKPQARNEFLRGADPFLVAFGKAHGYCVVTDELFVPGQKNKVKIPAACQEFGVPCMSPFEMLRREGVRLVLQPSPE
jgi:hypothetical protein